MRDSKRATRRTRDREVAGVEEARECVWESRSTSPHGVSPCVHQQQEGTLPAPQIFPMQRRSRLAAASRGNRQQSSTAERTSGVRATSGREGGANRAPQCNRIHTSSA
jgi:hypothetical protein